MRKINRQTKIIATIGPATESEELLSKIIKEGVDVLRLNMAHADHDWIRMITDRIRRVGKYLEREPAIMMDVKGPEIRTGYLHHELNIKKDDFLDLVFVAQPNPPKSENIWQTKMIRTNMDVQSYFLTPVDLESEETKKYVAKLKNEMSGVVFMLPD